MISLERRDGRPLRIGHRGAAALAPENTLRSFRAAHEAGVDLIEFDVFELGSGELVLAHSDDLHEVSHGRARGVVHRRDLSALRDVAPELPTLEEALDFFVDEAPEVGVHADLKSPRAVERTLQALRHRGLLERTLISSFHRKALRRVSQLEPRVRTGVAFPRDRIGIAGRRGTEPLIAMGLRILRPTVPAFTRTLIERSGAGALVLHHLLVSATTVERAHERRVPVVAWTIVDPRDYARMDAAGIDAIVLDNPAIDASTLQP